MTNDLLVPPHSNDAEQAVLGALMLNTDDERCQRVIGILKPTAFYRSQHQIIYRAILNLIKSRMPTDLITLSETLGTDLELVGGFGYLAEICSMPTLANVVEYARIVREKAIRRYAMEKLNICAELMMAEQGTKLDDQLMAMQQVISSVIDSAKTGSRGGLREVRDVLDDWAQDVERRFSSPDHAAGLTLGITGIDDILAPKQALRGSLVVVGARPKMGKTATYNAIATHFALSHKLPTLLFNLEMTDRSLVERMVAQEAHVSSNIFYTGAHDDTEMARAMAKVQELMNTKMMIDSTPGVRLSHIEYECRKAKRKYGAVGLVAIDYLTLMKAEQAERRDIAYGDITTGLKNLAKELDCVVLLLTQLNRQLEQRADKRPLPSDSKDTGNIEQDADVWIGIYRDAVYNENADKTLVEYLVRLNREGGTGTAYAQMINGYIKDIDALDAMRLMEASNKTGGRKYRGDIDQF
ncbi:replicative DNA helicase [Limnobaculum xujianqingii]|uniref:replicative DNA helicase n=1 Tax=Limnobaculum xujianqingii TaxID=2738837 RepID=UPI00112B0417|nr:DnaB-like helicase C-terminal domain-containing protein [Limnobaculum xujianqingii]